MRVAISCQLKKLLPIRRQHHGVHKLLVDHRIAVEFALENAAFLAELAPLRILRDTRKRSAHAAKCDIDELRIFKAVCVSLLDCILNLDIALERFKRRGFLVDLCLRLVRCSLFCKLLAVWDVDGSAMDAAPHPSNDNTPSATDHHAAPADDEEQPLPEMNIFQRQAAAGFHPWRRAYK